LDVIHLNGINDPNLNSSEITHLHELKTCQIEIQKLLMFFNYNTKQKINNSNHTNEIPYCNKHDFIKIKIVNEDTTIIIIPGGKFQPVPIRKQRSIIHVGTGKLIFSNGKTGNYTDLSKYLHGM